MSDSLSLMGVVISLSLPWLLGMTWVLLLLGRSSRWNYWILTGYGYLAGMFLTTLIIRLWDLVGLSLDFWWLAATLLIFTVAGVATLFVALPHQTVKPSGVAIPRCERAIVVALLALIAYRYSGIAGEILLRPLYPWDAWMNWAPKAINWFHNSQLTQYVSPEQWLDQTDDRLAYTAGATKAWKYPVTVPLIQLWGMLGAGAVDQNYSSLPWLFAPLAFALALYGHLRLLGTSTLLATIACYVFLSLPFVNVHSALAGYADIWLAIYFGAAVLCLQEWQRNKCSSWAALTVIFSFACTQLKLPGLVLGAIILAVFALSFLARYRNAILAVLAITLVGAVCAVFVGVDINIPAVGHVVISTDMIKVPYLGSYPLRYHPVHGALMESAFSMNSWHMFWYVMAATLMAKAFTGGLLTPPSIELITLSITLLFFGLVFYFTHISAFVLDFTTVNRVLLYLIPGFLLYFFRNLEQWSQAGSGDQRATR